MHHKKLTYPNTTEVGSKPLGISTFFILGVMSFNLVVKIASFPTFAISVVLHYLLYLFVSYIS